MAVDGTNHGDQVLFVSQEVQVAVFCSCGFLSSPSCGSNGTTVGTARVEVVSVVADLGFWKRALALEVWRC